MEQALISRKFGPYTLQAAIAAVHAEALDSASTDWPQITALYDALLMMAPSPIIELNRAMAEGPQAGLALLDALFARGELMEYRLAHSVRADLCRRLGRREEMRISYQQALALTSQQPEQRFLENRFQELE